MKVLLLPLVLFFGSACMAQSTPGVEALEALVKLDLTKPVSFVVKARAGDTVTTVAKRHEVDPVSVAKYNGLLPTTALGLGREIKIPLKLYENGLVEEAPISATTESGRRVVLRPDGTWSYADNVAKKP